MEIIKKTKRTLLIEHKKNKYFLNKYNACFKNGKILWKNREDEEFVKDFINKHGAIDETKGHKLDKLMNYSNVII